MYGLLPHNIYFESTRGLAGLMVAVDIWEIFNKHFVMLPTEHGLTDVHTEAVCVRVSFFA